MPPTDPNNPDPPKLGLGFWEHVFIWIETISIVSIYLFACIILGFVYLTSGVKISLGEHELDPDKQWERE